MLKTDVVMKLKYLLIDANSVICKTEAEKNTFIKTKCFLT